MVVRDRDDWKQQCDDYAAAVAARETEEDEASLQQQIKRYKKELVQAHEVSEVSRTCVLGTYGILWTHARLWWFIVDTWYIVGDMIDGGPMMYFGQMIHCGRHDRFGQMLGKICDIFGTFFFNVFFSGR
mgnify:FL=1